MEARVIRGYKVRGVVGGVVLDVGRGDSEFSGNIRGFVELATVVVVRGSISL